MIVGFAEKKRVKPKPNTFQAPAILTRIAYLKDGGLSIGFSTNELSDEDKLIASRFHGKFGWLLFSENQFTDADVPTADASDESKTPSQRLRAVLFVLWKQRGEPGDWEIFYRDQINKAIERVKRVL